MNFKTLLLILFGVFIFSINIDAQKDFSELSPKQKIKLGKKEQKAAKKDPEYLALMEEGLSFFQQKQYSKALAKYEEAQNRRPGNVYPMVMIDDIEIARNLVETQTNMETEVLLESTMLTAKEPEYKAPETNPKPDEIKREEPKQENPEIIETQTPDVLVINTPEKLEKEVTSKPNPVIIERIEEKVYENDGIYRETLKEGSATIEQITVVKNGVTTVIRQVVHTWGGVFYFKDKDAITKQEYQKLISELEE
jgi:TPR repeat protein